MPKYEVTFEGEAESEHELRRSLARAGFQDLSSVTELQPKFEEGWYQYVGEHVSVPGHGSVLHWKSYEIYDPETFHAEYRRVNPPTLYEERDSSGVLAEELDSSSQSKYKDGYYEMSDGYLYRRLDGIWSFQFKSTGEWTASEYNDDNIESESGETIKRVGE